MRRQSVVRWNVGAPVRKSRTLTSRAARPTRLVLRIPFTHPAPLQSLTPHDSHASLPTNLAFVHCLCVVYVRDVSSYVSIASFALFPLIFRVTCSPWMFTSIAYIGKFISVLQGPHGFAHCFVPSAWEDAEARAMLDRLSTGDHQNTMQGTAERLKSTTPLGQADPDARPACSEQSRGDRSSQIHGRMASCYEWHQGSFRRKRILWC